MSGRDSLFLFKKYFEGEGIDVINDIISIDPKYRTNSYVLIQSEADFPAAVDLGDGLGVCHHLVDNTTYFLASFSGNIILNFPLAIPSSTQGSTRGCKIDSYVRSFLVYTGSGAAIRSDSNGRGFTTSNVSISGINTNNLFSATLTSFACRNCIFNGFLSLGSITSNSYIVIEDTICFSIIGTGLTITGSGASSILIIDKFAIDQSNPILTGGSKIYLQVNGTWQYIKLGSYICNPKNGEFALNLDNTLTYTSIIISGCNIIPSVGSTGTALFTNSLNQKSPSVASSGNVGLPDSNIVGGLCWSGNATATVTNVTNTWFKIAGTTNTSASILERCTMPIDNKLLFSNTEPVLRNLLILVTLFRSSGSGTPAIELTAFQNGSQILLNANPVINAGNAQAAGNPVAISVSIPVLISPGDYFEAYIRNTTNTASITISSGQMIVS